eukprot:Phypoly_transcript_00918.p1 GENE.Phypoly_transcript_00918~~Phypoly_transcript_00918.p1  ORF type:complete len:972 (+),score=94.90 Phypoly_transcript_00918:85-3000(+)
MAMNTVICILFILHVATLVGAQTTIPPGTPADEFKSLLESASDGDTFLIQSNQDINTTIEITSSIGLVGANSTVAFVCNSTDFTPFSISTTPGFNQTVVTISLLRFNTCNTLATITSATLTLDNVQTPLNNNGPLFTAYNSTVSFTSSTINPFKSISLTSGSTLLLNDTSLGMISAGGGIISNNSDIIANGGTWGTYAPGIVLLQFNGGRLKMENIFIDVYHALAPSSTTTMLISNAGCNWTNTNISSSGMYPQGGVSISNSTVTFDGVTFDKLQLIGSPTLGALVLQSCNATLRNSVFSHNVNMQQKNGSALYSFGSNVTLEACTFTNNSAGLLGGGFYAENSTAFITHSFFLWSGGGYGGTGVYALFSTITMKYTAFAGNTASGLILAGGNYILGNCSIQHNSANDGGGAQVLGGQAIFYHTDISGNSAVNVGGGIYYSSLISPTTILVLDSTLLNNTANQFQAIDTSPSASTVIVRNSRVQEEYPRVDAGNYCCNYSIEFASTPSPSGQICNFPTCNSSACPNAVGCNCPFDFTFTWEQAATVIPSVTPDVLACDVEPCSYKVSNTSYYIPNTDLQAKGTFLYDTNLCSAVPCIEADRPCAICQFTGYDICVGYADNKTISALPAEYSEFVGFQVTYYGQMCVSNVARQSTVNVLCAGPGVDSLALLPPEEILTCVYSLTLHVPNCTGLVDFCAHPDLHNCSTNATCSNTPEGANCTCKSGYFGDGLACYDTDECNITGICGNDFCVNTDGSHLCLNCTAEKCNHHGPCAENGTCLCDQGYLGPFCNSCVLSYSGYPNCTWDPCHYNNGGCDFHVECSVDNGNLTCSDCPLGTTGSGYNTCVSLCGNDICEPSENCVSCYEDCSLVLCDICGDGICNADETCETCILDCHTNCSISCNCSAHGKCSPVGTCICDLGWSGPACSSKTAEITVTPNSTVPSVKITTRDTSSDSKYVSFGISVQTLSEYSK